MMHRPQSRKTSLLAALLALNTYQSDQLNILPLHALGNSPKNQLQALVGQMDGKENTKVYNLVKTVPQLENLLGVLAAFEDEVQRLLLLQIKT